MKNLFFLFATVMLLTVFQSCKQQAAEEEATVETTETVAEEPAPVVIDTPIDTSRIPVVPPDPIKK